MHIKSFQLIRLLTIFTSSTLPAHEDELEEDDVHAPLYRNIQIKDVSFYTSTFNLNHFYNTKIENILLSLFFLNKKFYYLLLKKYIAFYSYSTLILYVASKFPKILEWVLAAIYFCYEYTMKEVENQLIIELVI